MQGVLRVAVYDTKPYDREYLSQAAGTKIQWDFHEFRLAAATASTAAGATAVCVFVNDKVDRACLERLKEAGVKLIALRCAGFNNVDLAAAKELGLNVIRVPSYSPHGVAEHAVALLLSLNRKIHRAYNRVREHNFSLTGLVGFDVYKKTVGIVGTGKIGKVAAQIFKGFEADVLAYDPHPDQVWGAERQIRYVGLKELLAQSDIISLHVPLTSDTHHLIRHETVPQLKKGVVIINTGRGKLIQTSSLIEGLSSGHIGGVALDVYEEEEGIFFEDHSDDIRRDDQLSHLLSFPNVLVTSHQAFLTREALGEIARVTVENLLNASDSVAYAEGTQLA
ncbi:MAG TPA: 2-hydroxyacid dehydrogenase [Methylomirabilota bacterium]|nr:2-hydroxyacid dehydrogenase [Methylomirabilota bacterium]